MTSFIFKFFKFFYIGINKYHQVNTAARKNQFENHCVIGILLMGLINHTLVILNFWIKLSDELNKIIIRSCIPRFVQI